LAGKIKSDLNINSTLKMGRASSFEVTYKGKLLFSKLKENRFPEASEVLAPLKVIITKAK